MPLELAQVPYRMINEIMDRKMMTVMISVFLYDILVLYINVGNGVE